MANAAQYFVSRHSAGPLANKTAFREAQEGGAEITYGELDAQSDRMIGFFADHGLRREDRVAMLVLDEIAYPVAFFGALKSGVVPILLNTLLATPFSSMCGMVRTLKKQVQSLVRCISRVA